MSIRVDWALTLHRPWAAAMILGTKNLENRSWAPPKFIIGKTIALHSGKTLDEKGSIKMQEIENNLGVVDVMADDYRAIMATQMAVVGVAVVKGYVFVEQAEKTRWHASPWFFGPYGWVLEERRPLKTPVPCKGAQRLWHLPADVRHQVEAQL